MVKHRVWTLFFITICAHGSWAQSSPTITGYISESTTKDPLEHVNIVLRSLPDSLTVQNTLTDAQGKFSFNDIPTGPYYLIANLTGFATYTGLPFNLKNTDHYNAGTIALQAKDFLLDEIMITGDNPAFVNNIDRKLYYPENDILAQSGSASEILQNIPSVTIESEGEILMRGSANITFLLNGKSSVLLKNNAAMVLEQIPAHLIERIEVITNPSARYKPDGTAGIINIITKKNIATAFNGSVLVNASTQKRFNGNVSFNYNPGKINLSFLYGYWKNYLSRTSNDFRILNDSITGRESDFDLNSSSIGKPFSHTVSFNIDYLPNEKNTFGISANYFDLSSVRNIEITTVESDKSGIYNDYSTQRTDRDDEKEFELSAGFEHNFNKEDHTIAIEGGYGNYNELENSEFDDNYNFPAYPDLKGRTFLDKIENFTTLSLDYTLPFGEYTELEAGYEGEFVNGDNNYYTGFFDFDTDTWETDAFRSNHFLYQQDIHAMYATLSKTFDALGILGGLRAEKTIIESNLLTLDSLIPNEYFNLFPTIHFTYELNDEEELSLSYSRRVNRPDADELNPFPEYINIRDIEAGNPHLKPEQVHSVELAYHLNHDNFSFLPTLYYRQSYDAFSEVVRYINDSILLTTLENLASERSGGLELVFSWTPSKKLNLNLNTNLFYHALNASNLGYVPDRSLLSADTKLSAAINILPLTKMQINATYRTEMLRPQGRSLPFYFVNAGIKQELFKRKASLSLSVSDIFNTMRWQYIIDTPELYQKVSRKRKSQIVYLGFAYRFGISTRKNNEELLFDERL